MESPTFDILSGTAASYPIWPCYKQNPLRPADWRWQSALRCAANRLQGPHFSRHFDPEVHDAARFLRRLNDEHDPEAQAAIWETRPELAEALALSRERSWKRSELECWLLTRVPLDTVADRTRLSQGTVEAYRTYFFDLDDRSISWIVHSALAIHHERLSDEPYLYRVIKLYAYQLGSKSLEMLLELDIPNMPPPTIEDMRKHLADPSDRRQLCRALLASKMLPLDTPEQQLECLRFTLEMDQHPLYRVAETNPVLDPTLADLPDQSPPVAEATSA